MDPISGGNTFWYSTPAYTNSPDTSGHGESDGETEDIYTEESHAVYGYVLSTKYAMKNFAILLSRQKILGVQ